MQAPIWHDPDRPLATPLDRVATWGVAIAELRYLAGEIGDTLQSRCLLQLGEPELRGYVDRDRYPVPKPCDREGYWGDCDPAYWLSGLGDYLFLEQEYLEPLILQRERPAILDFGCASGRVLRHFACNGSDRRLFGTDFNVNNIAWIRRHLPPSILAATNATMPPLPFGDRTIDLAYAFSVFTHIDAFEEAWLLELHRVLRPGGRALLTVHSERTWPLLGRPGHFMLQQFEQPGHVVAGRPDLTVGRELFAGPMPDERVVIVNTRYPINNVNVFHTHAYLRERWGRIFAIERILDCAHGEHQDGVQLRRVD
jgi:SAM-dependent methyltransferase